MERILVHLPELLAFGALGFAASAARGSGNTPASPEATTTNTKHLNYAAEKSYESVIVDLEKQLGRFEPAIYQPSGNEKPNFAEIEAKSRTTEGSSGLMIFAKYEHGALLALAGKKAQARQYVVGNPLVALQMTQADIRAAEYAPLRMLVYSEEDGRTHIDYDLPSSVFGRFRSPEIDTVARGLDEKMEWLVRNALQ
ncbi:MAG TPA: DUF302 domain-containing protein [Candidatus Acidoferrum sp.]|nr:DUF302 domain-containing protein [Candidatus Acidoferrum sp.]